VPLLIAVLVLALLLAWWLGGPWLAERRRQRIGAQAFPAAWRRILRRRVPYVQRLPADLQMQLRRRIQIFIAEKPFIGCGGLVVTDEMRVTIAAQASLLLFTRPAGAYAGLRQILLYPNAFIVNRVAHEGGGVLRDERQVLAGESWSQGQVVLSWEDAREGAAVADDGRNVVIHEFAHQLDQENGPANGAPVLAPGQSRQRWAAVLAEAFAHLQAMERQGIPCLLSHYGATNPAEFFAVASEVFFEQPAQLAEAYPALFGELSTFYRVDPLSW
jgi:Mlc titration factor MtfA (ptsG expression regulator)